MSRWVILLCICATAFPLACAKQRGPQLAYSDEDAKPKDSAEEAYADAQKMFDKKYYDQAVEQFERLRNTYPFSRFAVEAELKVADALFAKGEFAEAADAYRTFTRLHPKHEKIDYATFRVGLGLFKDAPKSVDRDQSSTKLALREFKSFLARYPDSEYADKATEYVQKGRARLAEKELYVGRYYFKDKSYAASIPRFQEVVDRYPETDAAEIALFMLGKSQFLDGNEQAAVETLKEFLDRYPEAEDAAEARRMIRAGGGSVSTAKDGTVKGNGSDDPGSAANKP